MWPHRIWIFLIFTFSCVTVNSENAPVSTIGTVSTFGTSAIVSVTALNFNNIGSFDLRISYDPTIALAQTVTGGSGLGGVLAFNVSVPGQINIAWYSIPGVTLAANAIYLSLSFLKVTSGVCGINFVDDGMSCNWTNGLDSLLNDVPAATYYIGGSVTFLSGNAPHTIIPANFGCQGSMVDVPVMVTDFNSIGKFTLKLNYDPNILTLNSWTNVSGFTGLNVVMPTSGILIITGNVQPSGLAITLSDSAVLVSIKFLYSGGTGSITWIDDGLSCSYFGAPPQFAPLNDIPQYTYYIPGSVSPAPVPLASGMISGPAGGNVCPLQTGVLFSVQPIAGAYFYNWSMPAGMTITNGLGTNAITAFVSAGAVSGNIYVAGVNACGDQGSSSPAFPLVVNSPPAITVQPVSPPAVEAGKGKPEFFVGVTGGFLSYQWQVLSQSWENISDGGVYSGTQTDTLTVLFPPLSMNGYHYRCIVSGFCEPAAYTDGTSVLTVTPVDGIGKQHNIRPGVTVFPNPVDESTKVYFSVPAKGKAHLELINISGELVAKDDMLFDRAGSFSCKFFNNISAFRMCYLLIYYEVGGSFYNESVKILW